MLAGARDDVHRPRVIPHLALVQLDQHRERLFRNGLVLVRDHAVQKVLQRAVHALVAVLPVERADVVHDVREEQLAERLVGAAEEAEEEREKGGGTDHLKWSGKSVVRGDNGREICIVIVKPNWSCLRKGTSLKGVEGVAIRTGGYGSTKRGRPDR